MQAKVEREKEKMAAQAITSEAHADKLPATWAERMLALPASQRKCRYMITGEVANKICPNSYECGNCSFDQMMQERMESVVVSEQNFKEVSGLKVKEGFYYHEGHTWARPEHGGRVRVGLDDFARRLMGSLSKISLPEIGEELNQGEASFSVYHEGGSAPVLSPVDGVVTRLNHELLNNPSLINDDNYDAGWLFVVEPAKLKKNLKELMFGEDVETFMMAERDRLVEEAGREMRLQADGALMVDDVAGELKDENWSKFVRKFLRS